MVSRVTAPDASLNEGAEALSTSRRAFIGRTAAGVAAGGLVWAAPSILTLDAAAAASCGTGVHTLNWGTVTAGTSPASVVSTGGTGSHPTVTIGHTQTANTIQNNGLGGYDCFDVINSQIGGQTANSYLLSINTNSQANFVTVTFTFPAGTSVNGLSFQIFDIDYSTTYNFQDVVRITGVNSANAAATFSSTPNTSYTVANNNSATLTLTGLNYSGNPNTGVPPNSANGNATITSTQSIRSVTVTYSPGIPTDANPYQYISIGNLTWTTCT